MIDTDLLLIWGAAYKKVKAGETIFIEGHSCFFYYQLVSGSVRWVNIDDTGNECLHSIVEPGEPFGELPLFDDGIYAATAIANEDSVVIRLHKPTFMKLLKENADLNMAFTRLLAARLRVKMSMIKAVASHNPKNRITDVLNYHKSQNRNFCNNCNMVKLTRQQIADMTGLRVETVIRIMRNMHDSGELVITKGKVYFNDVNRVVAT